MEDTAEKTYMPSPIKNEKNTFECIKSLARSFALNSTSLRVMTPCSLRTYIVLCLNQFLLRKVWTENPNCSIINKC